MSDVTVTGQGYALQPVIENEVGAVWFDPRREQYAIECDDHLKYLHPDDFVPYAQLLAGALRKLEKPAATQGGKVVALFGKETP